MKIGILQVDGKLPNLALMQITSYHEAKGDQISWYQSGLFADYDKIYASKIFDFSTMPQMPANTMIGGTGIDFFNRLPPEIENHSISYTLYKEKWKPFNWRWKKKLIPPVNYHIGFSMKGCRFSCKFCCVPVKEGRPHVNSNIGDLLINPIGGNRLMLLDNDFFGGADWKSNLERIIELKLKVCFVQGLNIRIITAEQAILLARCNYQNSKFNQKYLTFAWDRYHDGKLVKKGIQICNDAGIPCHHMQFFVLIGFDSTHEQNMDRVMTLREMGCMPFAMPYNKNDPYQKAFTRWVNNRAVFKTCSWENYKYKKENADAT